jgi:hypothetical protein
MGAAVGAAEKAITGLITGAGSTFVAEIIRVINNINKLNQSL